MNRLIFRSLVALSLLCFSVLSARQVRADSVSYTYTVGNDTFKWSLPASPVIAPGNAVCGLPSSMCSFTLPGQSFTLQIGTGTPTPMTGTLDFFDLSLKGGFDLFLGSAPSGTPPFLIDNAGQVLFSGSVFAPTMSAFPSGVSLVEFNDSSNPNLTGMLTSTVISTPEPSIIFLLVSGLAFGLTLTVLRK